MKSTRAEGTISTSCNGGNAATSGITCGKMTTSDAISVGKV